MSTIFIGGSRHVSRLPAEVRQRLDNVIASGHQVVVGDANGADKAAQKHFLERDYRDVTVFCSGPAPRNNLGSWTTRRIDAPAGAKGFQFYAAKDREMAREADFGLMIWDGKSPGTVLNVLRLVQAGKISVLFNVPAKAAVNMKSADQYRDFILACEPQFRSDLKDRATSQEWSLIEPERQPSLLAPNGEGIADVPRDTGTNTVPDAETNAAEPAPRGPIADEFVHSLNTALTSGDAARFMDMLGSIARERGMTQVARETGLARESLYRSLDGGGNPEFLTVMKVLASLGVTLEAKPRQLSTALQVAAD